MQCLNATCAHNRVSCLCLQKSMHRPVRILIESCPLDCCYNSEKKILYIYMYMSNRIILISFFSNDDKAIIKNFFSRNKWKLIKVIKDTRKSYLKHSFYREEMRSLEILPEFLLILARISNDHDNINVFPIVYDKIESFLACRVCRARLLDRLRRYLRVWNLQTLIDTGHFRFWAGSVVHGDFLIRL